MKLLIVVEETDTGYSAYAPDLPGCVATGPSRAEVEVTMRDAVEFHIEGLQRSGLPVPQPHTYGTMVDVIA